MEAENTPSVSAVQCSVIQYSVAQPPTQVPSNGENNVTNSEQDSLPFTDSTSTNDVEELPNGESEIEIIEKELECSTLGIIEDVRTVRNEKENEVVCKGEEEEVAGTEENDVICLEKGGELSKQIEEIEVKEENEIEEIPVTAVTSDMEIREEETGSVKEVKTDPDPAPETSPSKKRGKKKAPVVLNGIVEETSHPQPVEHEVDSLDSESDDEIESKPRRRGRCKKNPELIPPHLAPDIALGYRMLLKFLETPQFSVFQRPGHLNVAQGEDTKADQIICLNQIKKKFDENSYDRLADFVNDVRSLLTNVYEAPRNSVAVKRALRLEQLLEQRIAQLPNYLRPQCSLILTADESNSNSPQKIRINKGGGFVSLLLERAEKLRVEKDREKRKVLAEERKQLKEEQDKDVQDWEKNVLLKEHEEEIRSMWELPQIGHFIHLCANILNIGDVSQYEVERMLLMPQCSDTLDLLITALLSNSLMRAKLDRTPSMPYSIWAPLVRTRVNAWYRALQREFGNTLKVFEEVGVEPQFWEAVGSEHSPLEHSYFHEIPLFQRVWILKTLCDVDFVRKKTVNDYIRQQSLEELSGTYLGVDRHANRYLHFPQFGMTALRIYRESTTLEKGIAPADLVESTEGFEDRRGEITLDKVFRDIWDVGTKTEPPKKRGRRKKTKKQDTAVKIKVNCVPPKSLRQSARAKRKVYVDGSDSEGSDTDLATLKNKLTDQNKSISEKTFISLSVFRLPREKVKVNIKKSYYSRKLEREEMERLKNEERELKDSKLSGFDEEASESMDLKLGDDDDDDDAKDNFTVKNLENLKMVLKKGNEDTDNATDPSGEDTLKFKYDTPASMLPDKNKFYLVVDSVDGLRQLISQFSSDDNDLEIVNRSRSGRKSGVKPGPPSCEVLLIERLQRLLEELESWEMDFVKTSRSIRDKLYREYTAFLNRPDDFVHPNEAFWLKMYEDTPPPVPPPPPEPEPPPAEPALPEIDSSIFSPPSPLGGLRPRTRTRQQQQQQQLQNKIEHVLDEDLDDELFESSESDDNWELPSRKKRKSTVDSPKTAPKTARQSKRVPKKKERGSSPGRYVDGFLESSEGDDYWEPPSKKTQMSTDDIALTSQQAVRKSNRVPKKRQRFSSSGSADSDKGSESSKQALFWSPRSSDPSEDLNWERNRQKILEKHNSPRKAVTQTVSFDNDGNEIIETPLRGKIIGPCQRILPQPIPGNKKPYYSAAQLKAMAKNKDPDVEFIGSAPSQDVQIIQTKSPKRPRPTARPILKKSASTQSNDIIELDGDLEIKQPMTVKKAQTLMVQPTQMQQQQLEFFLTDGTSLFKVDGKFVEDMMSNEQLLRLNFGDKLDLTKPIHVVKKKPDNMPQPIQSKPASVNVTTANVQPTIIVPGKPCEPSMRKIVTSTQPAMSEPAKVGTGLRFIRPQNVSPSQMAFMKPTQITNSRPISRMPAPQQSVVYLQTTQSQGLIQLPAGVQVVTQAPTSRSFPTGAQGVQVVTQRPMDSSATGSLQNEVQLVTHRTLETAAATTSVPVPNQMKPGESGQVTVFTSAPTPAQFGYLQMQSGNKQPTQLVAVSQSKPQVSTSVQTSTPTGFGANNQNLVRIVSTAPSGPAHSYVRLATTGSPLNIVQMAGSQGATYAQQLAAGSTIVTSTVGTGTYTQANTLGLVQVQGLPGEPISYVQLQAPNFLQLQQSSGKSQPTLVQLSSPTPRQQSPGARLVQVPAPQQPSGQQAPGQPRPQATMVQMVTQRPQTTVYQVYGSPRMVQMQGLTRPTNQLPRPPAGLVPVSTSVQASPRLQGAIEQKQTSIGAVQGNVVRQQIPFTQVQRFPLQSSPRAQGAVLQMQTTTDGSPRPQGTIVSMPTSVGLVTQRSQSSVVTIPSSAGTVLSRAQDAVVSSSAPVVSGVPRLQGTMTSVPSSAGSVVPRLPGSVAAAPMGSGITRPQGTMFAVQTSQVQGTLRPQSTQSMTLSPRPTLMQVQTGTSAQTGNIPKVVTQMVQGGATVQTPGGLQKVVSQMVQTGTVAQGAGGVQKVVTQMVQQSTAVQSTGGVGKVVTQMVQAGGNSPKPVEIQVVQLQPGTYKQMMPQLLTSQGGSVGGKPMSAQIVHVPAGTQVPNSVRPMTAQIVQVPMMGGKTGYFQIDNGPGQPMTIVQVVTSAQPATPTSSVKTVYSVQSQAITPNFIQVSSPIKETSGVNSTGLPQNSLSGIPQAGTPTILARARVPQAPPSSAGSLQTKTADSTVRFVTSSPGQTVRFVGVDGKPVQALTLQPSLVRNPGTRMQIAGSNRLVSVQQPVLIKIDEDEDDIKVVGGSLVPGSTETVDILHGELSAKETSDGWRYSVKTSSGADHVLTNAEVERRRAANNGRMF